LSDVFRIAYLVGATEYEKRRFFARC